MPIYIYIYIASPLKANLTLLYSMAPGSLLVYSGQSCASASVCIDINQMG